jgi:NitT/TauT family transport system substrate-binding protein
MRRFSLLLSGLLVLALLAGCGKKSTDVYQKEAGPAPLKEPVTLKIGQLPIVDGLPFWVAEQKGFFKDQGVNVELVTFKSANERDAAIMSGQIDGMLADLIATSTLVSSGTKVKIASLALGAKQEEGPIGIVAAPNSGISDLKDLKGQEIAISTNSVIHYVTEKLLEESGLKPDEVKLTNIPSIPVRYESLMAGKIKAAALPDPLLTLAEKKGAKLLATDAKAKQNYSHSVIVFTEEALNKKAEGIKHFFIAYNRAVAAINLGPDDYTKMVIEKGNLPLEVAIWSPQPFSMAQAPKKEDVERVLEWLEGKQLLKSKLTYEQLVGPALFPQP